MGHKTLTRSIKKADKLWSSCSVLVVVCQPLQSCPMASVCVMYLQVYCSMHRLSLDLLEGILIKTVGAMYSELIKQRCHCHTTVSGLLATVNSVCLPWWNVLTGRRQNKRRLRRLLDGKSC